MSIIQNNSASQNNHENAADGVVVFDNDDLNDSNNQSDKKSAIKSIADNHPNDNNMYFAIGLLLLICLFGVIVVKKNKN